MQALSQQMRFTDEQAMLLETAVNFCREQSPIGKVRQLLASAEGFDRSVWDAMVQLGWSGIAVPESLGGSGLSLAEVATLAEPMGRQLLSTPFINTQLFVQGLLAGGNAAQHSAWLPAVCQGAIGTVALMEEEGDWDILRPAAQASLQGGIARLSGVKTLVCDAAVADRMLVSVQLEGEAALVILGATQLAAVPREAEVPIDETRRSHRLVLDGVQVPAEALIRGQAAQRALLAIRDAGLLLASAEACGGIAGVLAVVVDYLNLRTTFGRKIGSYQSLKHTCAEILVGLERARSHLYHAASLIAQGEPAEIALRMAKVESGDTFVFAGDRAVQFHGGFGFTYECDAQLYLRRALWLQYAFGDAPHHRRRLADALLPLVAA